MTHTLASTDELVKYDHYIIILVNAIRDRPAALRIAARRPAGRDHRQRYLVTDKGGVSSWQSESRVGE
jgi:hypothetical protein